MSHLPETIGIEASIELGAILDDYTTQIIKLTRDHTGGDLIIMLAITKIETLDDLYNTIKKHDRPQEVKLKDDK